MARAVARIDLGAVRDNCARLKAELGAGAELCAVVKADGYGHGADACAEAALAGGATRLAVATAAEAGQIGRRFPHVPLLTMGALTPEELDTALAAGSEVAVWRADFRDLVAARARAQGRPARVHVKHDSGMGRLGNRDPAEVLALLRACAESPDLELAGVWTHFATADEPDSGFFDEQLDRFARGRRGGQGRVPRRSPSTPPTAPPSSATAARTSTWRAAASPSTASTPSRATRPSAACAPALSLRSYVADVKRFEPGDSAGYGQTWRAERETWVGVLPLGYGDGVRRGLSNNAEVLVGGRRHPLVGTVSMDNVTIDLGPDTDGRARRRGGADRLAGRGDDPRRGGGRRLGTINYEITCGISARVPREAAMSLAERLAAAPLVGLARRALPGGAEAWIVGGAVRDAALGREVTDLDLAVAGDPERGGEGDRPRGRRARLRALGRVRDLARGRPRRRLAGRRDRAARRDDRGRPGRARLHHRRRRGAARRWRADRSPRWPRRPRAASAAGRRRGQLPRRPAAPAARRPARRRARAGGRPRHGGPGAGRKRARAAEPAGERQLAELRRLLGGPDPLRGLGAARRARPHRGRAARAGGAARGRAGPQPPPRRPRPHAGRARADARGRGRPGALRRRARRRDAGAARRAARRRDEPRHGAALRRPPARHRQAGDAGRARRLRHLHRPRQRGRRDRRRDLPAPARQPPADPPPAGADPAPPAARLPGPRGAAAAAARPRVPAGDRAGRRRRHPAHRRRPALGPRQRARSPPRRRSRPTSSLAREMLAAALDWRRDGPPEPLLRGDELAAELGIAPGPSWASCWPSSRPPSTRAR